MSIPKSGSIPGKDSVSRTVGRLRRYLAAPDGTEEPGDWELTERTPERMNWRHTDTQQLVVCEREREGAWIARAKPAIIDGEAVDISLTAGPTSREIAEFLARQYMAHELVLAPITAMQPRR